MIPIQAPNFQRTKTLVVNVNSQARSVFKKHKGTLSQGGGGCKYDTILSGLAAITLARNASD